MAAFNRLNKTLKHEFMKNKLFILVCGLSFVFFLGLFSCNEDDCGPFNNAFKTVDLEFSIHEAIYSEDEETKLVLNGIENDSVDYDLYAISVRPVSEFYMTQNTNSWSFSLIQSAYACTPPIPSTEEQIDSIVIVSETDFDLDHPAGTDLSGLFDIVVTDYVFEINQERNSLEEFLATSPTVPSEWALILKEQPEETKNFAFSIKYYQNGIDDNDYFEFMTDEVVLRRE